MTVFVIEKVVLKLNENRCRWFRWKLSSHQVFLNQVFNLLIPNSFKLTLKMYQVCLLVSYLQRITENIKFREHNKKDYN